MTVAGKHGTPWSAAEIAELESMVSQQIDRKEIAAKLGRTQTAVEAMLFKLNGKRQAKGRSGKGQQRRRSGASFFLS